MPINSPQSVRFSNEKVRVAADKMVQAYNFANRVIDEWNAAGGATLIPNTSELVVDGSATDGRPEITGAMVNNVVNRLSELVIDYEAFSNAKLNTLLQVAVNTGE